MTSGRRLAREVLVELLRAHAVQYVFGNPGSTELPLIDELARHPDMGYVHALQENTAVAAADGYARMTGRPAFVNLHTMGGLAGGMSNLTNAHTHRTPLVVTAGQPRSTDLILEPVLSGDLTALARPVSKWTHELRSPDELPIVLNRAFSDAANPPAGPVFVSLPIDILDAPIDAELVPPPRIAPAGPAGNLDEVAEMLAAAAPHRLAIVVGSEAAPAAGDVSALATALGCPVLGGAFSNTNPFSTEHPAWGGYLPLDRAEVRKVLEPFSTVFVIGAPAFLLYDHGDGPALPEHVSLVHLDTDPARLGRNECTALGVVGDIPASVRTLVDHVSSVVDGNAARETLAAHQRTRVERDNELRAQARQSRDETPVTPLAAVQACLDALPPETIVVDEAVTASRYVRALHKTSSACQYLFCRGAALGWAMPAALGVQLARPDSPVVCLVGDGAAAYSIQALWTAAHHRIPVVYVVLHNRQYRILRDELRRRGGPAAASERFVAMDLDDPAPDYVRVAEGFGVEAVRVDTATALTEAITKRLHADRPGLVEIAIQGGR